MTDELQSFNRLLPEVQKEIRERVIGEFKKNGMDPKELEEHGYRISLSAQMVFEVEVDAKDEKVAILKAIQEAEIECFDDPDWKVEKIEPIEEIDTIGKHFRQRLEEEAEKILLKDCPGQTKMF